MTEWKPPATIEEHFAAFDIGGTFGSINRPTAGPRREEAIPRGEAPVQLYSLGTPNGFRASILLEELEEAGLVTYDAHKINIMNGDQFTSGFSAVNPNGKIPAASDYGGPTPVHLFESASICTYLAEKYGHGKLLLAHDPALKAEVFNWIFWSIGGQGPISGGCYGHFFCYAPADKVEARDYGVYRYESACIRSGRDISGLTTDAFALAFLSFI